ncbi:hypothetical protein GOB87_15935 [Acetobacter estunensis]|uniref:Uncharacterized protein n=1 Tax=Acetobacter estunensis TaxID=104097 RepID=A0A967BBA3_9PROT|nr:hypothetical protein [Acetobacter estunensis]NHO55396.1 hypothetical protein [Acetobacter estunensis]
MTESVPVSVSTSLLGLTDACRAWSAPVTQATPPESALDADFSHFV